MRLLAAAAFLLGAAAAASAQPAALRLDNGLLATWERGGAYDAVAMAFVSPDPPGPRWLGARPVLTAALRAVAHQPGGPADRVGDLGGSLVIGEAGGRVELLATGLSGSAASLIAALADVVAGPLPTRSLIRDGSLQRHLDDWRGEAPVQAEAVRRLLGAPWYPEWDEIAATAASLQPSDLDRLRAEWFSASRCAVAVVAGPASVTPEQALSPLRALPPGHSTTRLSRSPTPEPGEPIRGRENRGQSIVGLAAAGPDPFGRDAPAWLVAAHYLGAGNASPLFRRIRAQEGLSYLLGSRWMGLEGGVMWAEAHCDPGDEPRAAALMRLVIDQEARGLPPDDRTRRSVRWAQTEWYRDMMSPAKRARLRAAGMAMGAGTGWPEAFGEAITNVRAQDIRLVLETLCTGSVSFQIESGSGVGRS